MTGGALNAEDPATYPFLKKRLTLCETSDIRYCARIFSQTFSYNSATTNVPPIFSEKLEAQKDSEKAFVKNLEFLRTAFCELAWELGLLL